MTPSGTVTGGSSSPDSTEFGRAGTPDLGDELSELAPILDSVHLAPHKAVLSPRFQVPSLHKYTSTGHSLYRHLLYDFPHLSPSGLRQSFPLRSPNVIVLLFVT
ncbi:hypothetical protein CLF_112058 [Clonorchis sinensis]|uniref:Uncharacterized protein n=1 Tax=Clonorchis sinensis TaxID=79923 RepID=G7YVR8_CLOSI|nr:hypothetical protein CLF_112058 [Clonorchis sinensis]